MMSSTITSNSGRSAVERPSAPLWHTVTWPPSSFRLCSSTAAMSRSSSITSTRTPEIISRTCLPARDPLIQHRHDEKIQQSRCQQASKYHYRHRMLDLVTGPVASQRDRKQCQGGRQPGHQDGRQTFFRTSNQQMFTSSFTLLMLQVPVVADQHDSIARGDSNHSNKSDERTQRKDATGQEGHGDRAYQGERQAEKHDRRQTRRLKVRIEDQQNADDCHAGQREQPPACGFARRVFAQEFRMVTLR